MYSYFDLEKKNNFKSNLISFSKTSAGEGETGQVVSRRPRKCEFLDVTVDDPALLNDGKAKRLWTLPTFKSANSIEDND